MARKFSNSNVISTVIRQGIRGSASSTPWDSWSAQIESHARQWLVLIVGLAFVTGLSLIVIRAPSIHTGETATYFGIAENLIHGKGYSICEPRYFPFCSPTNQVTASREPIPVLLFALTALLFQHPYLAASLLELFIFLGTLVFLYALTKTIAGVREALLAAFLWAFYPAGLRLLSQASGDLLASFAVTASVYYVLRARQTNRNRYWILAGLSLGVSVLSRSATVVIAGVIMTGILLEGWRNRRHIIRWLRPILLFGIAGAGLVFPWVARNTVVLGSPVIGSTLTGYNIYRHNHLLGDPNYLSYVGGVDAEQTLQDILKSRPDLLGTENEVQMDQVYRQEGLKVISAHPIRYLSLSAFRFLPLWFNWSVKEAYGDTTRLTDYLMMGEQLVLLVLAVFSVVQQSRETWPLWGSILVFCLTYMAVNSLLRYLIPVMPLVIGLAAAGCNAISGRFVHPNDPDS